jgi:4-diphosphocytidyl-2C-methyl-D-erythritol kinase
MTTTVIVATNGNYVSSVKVNGEDRGTVGPGSNVQRSFGIMHGSGPTVFEISEREATPDEIEAAKPKET